METPTGVAVLTGGGLSKRGLARLRTVLAGYVERGEVPGMVALVARRGAVHAEALGTLAAGGQAPVRRDSIFRIASVSKSIAAAAALVLVEECRLRLDDPVDALLPELADRRVLKRLDGPLDDTVPAHRPITLRDLLTFRLGYGLIMAPPDTYPYQRAAQELGVAVGPPGMVEPPAPDEWLRRLGTLPLLHQPGERWLYHTGSDVLGVLIARATGRPLEAFLRERLFEPLGMRDTAFSVPAEEIDRLATAYLVDGDSGALKLFDEPATGAWSRPPVFPSAGGGLVSTADDLLAFGRMLLDRGRCDGGRVLSRPAVETMMADHLTPAQKAASGLVDGFFDTHGWGFGGSVVTRRDDVAATPGKFGWEGGLGTSFYVDPAESMVTVLMTQRAMSAPLPPPVYRDFWTCAYAAIDD